MKKAIQLRTRDEMESRDASPGEPVKITQQLERLKPKLTQALGRAMPADRFLRIVMSALRQTPKIAECDQTSVLGSVLLLAQLGLEPNSPKGHAYLIPRFRKNQAQQECTALIGYQGFVDIAVRSGHVDYVQAYVVKPSDKFDFELGTSPRIFHRPSLAGNRDEEEVIAAYARAQLTAGGSLFRVIGRDEIERRRAASGSSTYGPWVDHFESMCRKSAIRALWKDLPRSDRMATASALEEAAERNESQLGYVDHDLLKAAEIDLGASS